MRAPLRPRDICALLLVGVFAVAASGTHVVRSGESLHTIARDHGTTIRALVDANGITDPNLILAGQELSIPAAPAGSTGGGSGSSGGTYTVRSGDTLAGIAARHGTTVAAIAAANGISNPNLIVIGRSLHLASGGSGGVPAAPSAQPSSGRQLAGQRHTVQAGETIAGIARRYGIRTEDLIAWNGLVDGNLYATTRLALFNPGTLPSFGGGGGSAGGTHTVTAGQTLSSIASRYGVSSKAIAEANGISDPHRIGVGQRLAVPGAASDGGGFVCPVPGGSFFNDWAFPRSGGRAHAGTDVFAARGTPVRAPVGGVVEIATGSIGGKQFRLTTAEGHLLFGSHLHSFGATGRVRAGEVIGTVGDTGNAAGGRPHLHFEIHPAGAGAVNPFPLLRQAC